MAWYLAVAATIGATSASLLAAEKTARINIVVANYLLYVGVPFSLLPPPSFGEESERERERETTVDFISREDRYCQ